LRTKDLYRCWFSLFSPPPSPLGKWVYTLVDNWQVPVADSNNLGPDMWTGYS
jgi:hypothetical protein